MPNKFWDQVRLLDDRFKHQQALHQSFAVSAQHYAFVVNAFVELIKEINSPTYKFTLRETETEIFLMIYELLRVS